MVREPKWMVVAVGIPRRQTEDHKVRNQHQKHLSLRENARCRSQTEGRDHGIDGRKMMENDPSSSDVNRIGISGVHRILVFRICVRAERAVCRRQRAKIKDDGGCVHTICAYDLWIR